MCTLRWCAALIWVVAFVATHRAVLSLWQPFLPRVPVPGQVYRLLVQFTDRYPLESPVVTFIPPAPVHPHIYSNGHICLDILYDSSNGGWSPALTINKASGVPGGGGNWRMAARPCAS